METRNTLTVYAIENNGTLFRVARYALETALKVVNDETVKYIVKSDRLIAVNADGVIIATSENIKYLINERVNAWKRF